MGENKKIFFSTVTDIALCQKCPALLAYKIFKHRKNAWRVGIQGGDSCGYGSIFHENIAKKFFELAANIHSELHEKISDSLKNPGKLEKIIREKIFIPFLERKSQNLSDGQIISMARAVKIWAKAMSEFFSDIPLLKENISFVFHEPEKKLQSFYDFPEGRLFITGCYDALLFNPDKGDARLFEFKGYRKNDVVVPLSQSLIYAWLVYKHSGIIPSIEIIYLDEGREAASIFYPKQVRDMILNLPALFRTAFNVIYFHEAGEFLRDEILCGVCNFKNSCRYDWQIKK